MATKTVKMVTLDGVTMRVLAVITPEEIQATIVAERELERSRQQQDDRQPLYVPVPEYGEELPKQEAPALKRGVIVICF